jgi:hypothetical protein
MFLVEKSLPHHSVRNISDICSIDAQLSRYHAVYLQGHTLVLGHIVTQEAQLRRIEIQEMAANHVFRNTAGNRWQ